MKGLTLIETIVYVALLSGLMTGVLACTQALLAANEKLQHKVLVEQEGTFVLAKLEWLLRNTATIFSYGYHNDLSVATKDGGSAAVFLQNGSVQMQEAGGVAEPLTTTNVVVTDLHFFAVPASSTLLSYVEASTTIDGEVFTTEQ